MRPNRNVSSGLYNDQCIFLTLYIIILLATDQWTIINSLLQVGNTVPPPLAKAIGHEIVHAMKVTASQRKDEISV